MSDLWDIKRCAEFLGITPDYFRKIRHQPIYPQPLDLPGRPRWPPEAWERWKAERIQTDFRQITGKDREINA